MYISRWIPKATNTHFEYVILVAFPLQKWLHEHVSMFLNKHIARIVSFAFLIPLCPYFPPFLFFQTSFYPYQLPLYETWLYEQESTIQLVLLYRPAV